MTLKQRAHSRPVSAKRPQGRFVVQRSGIQRGFTLLELLVVMVIIGLLVGYVGPRYFAQIGKSEVKAALAQIDGLEKAVEQYRLDVGKFPSNEQGLNALFVRPATEPRWQGPYLKKIPPPDPWGNPYVYRTPTANGDFEIISLGKDGAPGGEGEAADISK
jgi:general secretion pathway protein G